MVARIIIAMGDGVVSLVYVGVSLAKLHVVVLYLGMPTFCRQFFLSWEPPSFRYVDSAYLHNGSLGVSFWRGAFPLMGRLVTFQQ